MNDNNGLKEPVASSLPAELSLAFTGTQLLKVSAVGLILGIASYGVGFGVGAIIKTGCNTESSICTLGGYLSVTLDFILNIAIAAYTLKRLRVTRFLHIVLFANISLFPASLLLSTMTRLEAQLILILAGLLYAAAYSFYYWLFNGLRLDPTNRLVIAVILATLMIFGSTHLGNQLGIQEYENEQQSKIEGYDFALYRPTYIPAGYRIDSVSPSYDDDPAAYLEVSYSYGDDYRGAPGLFHIYVFNSSNGQFNPPGDCGPEHPNDILSYDFPCAEIGVTPRGDRIYHHISDFSNQYNTYAKMGDSVVVLASNDDHMDKSELLRIMGSLQPTTARELKALYEQDNKK